MNVEFVANHVQIWETYEEPDAKNDYGLCFTRNGVYVTVGISEELLETLRQWLNNIHSSKESAKNGK